MTDKKRRFLPIAAIAAVALVAAACSSSDDSTPAASGGDAPTMAAPSAADLFAAAQDARSKAEAAGTDAADAVDAATKASMGLDTMSVNGNSMMAETNAQDVLDARTTAAQAVMDAKAALGSATEAKADAADLEDGALKTSLIAALDAAIKVAEEQMEAATESRDSDELKAAAVAVEGADPEAEGYPTSPTDIAERVAMDIGMALLPTTGDDGAGTRVVHSSDAAVPAAEVMNEVEMNDHTGMTWEEIVGSANVKDMRIADGVTGNNKQVKAASFAGMTLATITDGTPPTLGGDVVDGMQFVGLYSEIPGTVFCAGDCKVETVDETDTLTGSWYFTPDSPKAWYLGTTEDGVTTYAAEDLYATYGHWVSVSDDAAALATVNTYSRTDGNVTGVDDVATVNTGEDATTLTDTSATYRGDAVGMSVHKTFDTDAMQTSIASGAFTATAVLNATFGPNATLGGKISGFEGGAVDSDWSVELQVRAFDGSFVDDTDNGRTVASGRDGEWTAQAYGVDGERPTGIFGGFNAHFSDGHAAGAYATR